MPHSRRAGAAGEGARSGLAPEASDLGQAPPTLWGLCRHHQPRCGQLTARPPPPPGGASPSQAEAIMHLVQLGKLRHRAVRSCQCHSSWAERSGGPGLPPPSPGALLLLIHVAVAPSPFRPELPGDSTTAAPDQESGLKEEGNASAIQPSMLLLQPLDLPEALSAPGPSIQPGLDPYGSPSLPWRWAH